MFEKDIIRKRKRIKNLNYLVEMPELYDFIYRNIFSYDRRKEIVTNYGNFEDIVILGCGSGIFMEKIQEDYNKIIGIDKDRRMLELSNRRCDCKLKKQDIIDSIELDSNNHRLFTLLGNVSATLTINQLSRLFDNIIDNIGAEGVFIIDYTGRENNRKDNIQSFRQNGIKVERDITYNQRSDHIEADAEYKINIDNSKYSFTESFGIRKHRTEDIREQLLSSGFNDVSLVEDYERKILVSRT